MNTAMLSVKTRMSRTATYHVNLAGRRIRVRADHAVMQAMLLIIMAARDAIQAASRAGRAA